MVQKSCNWDGEPWTCCGMQLPGRYESRSQKKIKEHLFSFQFGCSICSFIIVKSLKGRKQITERTPYLAPRLPVHSSDMLLENTSQILFKLLTYFITKKSPQHIHQRTTYHPISRAHPSAQNKICFVTSAEVTHPMIKIHHGRNSISFFIHTFQC